MDSITWLRKRIENTINPNARNFFLKMPEIEIDWEDWLHNPDYESTICQWIDQEIRGTYHPTYSSYNKKHKDPIYIDAQFADAEEYRAQVQNFFYLVLQIHKAELFQAAWNFFIDYTQNPHCTNMEDWVRLCITKMQERNLALGQSAISILDEALTLVALSLNLSVEELSFLKTAKLSQTENAKILLNLLKRIYLKIPVAYTTEKSWFCGKLYFVDKRVLIPRSPIEDLINYAFSSFFDEKNPPASILDLCTGSGCLGIASAHAFPFAKVVLSDISKSALEVAQINIQKHRLESRVSCAKANVWNGLPENQKYDLIISNPPYVDTQLLQNQAKEFKQEPDLALDGGSDGLCIARVILREAKNFLNPNGWLILEVGTSWEFLEQAYPQVPFMWLEFESGAQGVLAISYADLQKYASFFAKTKKNKKPKDDEKSQNADQEANDACDSDDE